MSFEDVFNTAFLSKIGWKYVLLFICECIVQTFVPALRDLFCFALFYLYPKYRSFKYYWVECTGVPLGILKPFYGQFWITKLARTLIQHNSWTIE